MQPDAPRAPQPHVAFLDLYSNPRRQPVGDGAIALEPV